MICKAIIQKKNGLKSMKIVENKISFSVFKKNAPI